MNNSYDFRMGPNNPAAYLECGQGSANAYCKVVQMSRHEHAPVPASFISGLRACSLSPSNPNFSIAACYAHL